MYRKKSKNALCLAFVLSAALAPFGATHAKLMNDISGPGLKPAVEVAAPSSRLASARRNNTSSVREPSSILMFALGVVSIAGLRRLQTTK